MLLWTILLGLRAGHKINLSHKQNEFWMAVNQAQTCQIDLLKPESILSSIESIPSKPNQGLQAPDLHPTNWAHAVCITKLTLRNEFDAPKSRLSHQNRTHLCWIECAECRPKNQEIKGYPNLLGIKRLCWCCWWYIYSKEWLCVSIDEKV